MATGQSINYTILNSYFEDFNRRQEVVNIIQFTDKVYVLKWVSSGPASYSLKLMCFDSSGSLSWTSGFPCDRMHNGFIHKIDTNGIILFGNGKDCENNYDYSGSLKIVVGFDGRIISTSHDPVPQYIPQDLTLDSHPIMNEFQNINRDLQFISWKYVKTGQDTFLFFAHFKHNVDFAKYFPPYKYISHYDEEFMVLKVKEIASPIVLINGIASSTGQLSGIVSLNETENYFLNIISWNFDNQNVQIEIYDSLNNIIQTKKIGFINGVTKVPISLNRDIKNGTYTFKINTNSPNHNLRVCK